MNSLSKNIFWNCQCHVFKPYSQLSPKYIRVRPCNGSIFYSFSISVVKMGKKDFMLSFQNGLIEINHRTRKQRILNLPQRNKNDILFHLCIPLLIWRFNFSDKYYYKLLSVSIHNHKFEWLQNIKGSWDSIRFHLVLSLTKS